MANLPPISDDQFDGQKFSVEFKPKRCQHTFNWINGHEIRCTKCGVAYTGTVDKLNEIYEHFNKNA
jgi:hypothetical protein